MLNKFRNNDKGFTLVELMMVIVILGVLAGVAIPMVGRMRKNAATAKLNSYADSFGTAILVEMLAVGTNDLSDVDDPEELVSVSDAEFSVNVASGSTPTDTGNMELYHLDIRQDAAGDDITITPYFGGEGLTAKTFTLPD